MRLPPALVLATVAVALGACSDGGPVAAKATAERMCRSAHDATACVERASDGRWRLVAEGFRPNSVLQQALASSSAPPIETTLDDHGRIPPAATAGVVVPAGRTTLVVSGIAVDGSSVTLRFEVRA